MKNLVAMIVAPIAIFILLVGSYTNVNATTYFTVTSVIRGVPGDSVEVHFTKNTNDSAWINIQFNTLLDFSGPQMNQPSFTYIGTAPGNFVKKFHFLNYPLLYARIVDSVHGHYDTTNVDTMKCFATVSRVLTPTTTGYTQVDTAYCGNTDATVWCQLGYDVNYSTVWNYAAYDVNVLGGPITIDDTLSGFQPGDTLWSRVIIENGISNDTTSQMFVVATPVTAPMVAQNGIKTSTWNSIRVPLTANTHGSAGYILAMHRSNHFSSFIVDTIHLQATTASQDTAMHFDTLQYPEHYYEFYAQIFNSAGSTYLVGGIDSFATLATPPVLNDTAVTAYLMPNYRSIYFSSSYSFPTGHTGAFTALILLGNSLVDSWDTLGVSQTGNIGVTFNITQAGTYKLCSYVTDMQTNIVYRSDTLVVIVGHASIWSFTSDSLVLHFGDTTTVHWVTANGNAMITPYIGAVSSVGSHLLVPYQTTTLVMTVCGFDTASQYLTITVIHSNTGIQEINGKFVSRTNGVAKLYSETGQVLATYKVEPDQIILNKNDLTSGIYFVGLAGEPAKKFFVLK